MIEVINKDFNENNKPGQYDHRCDISYNVSEDKKIDGVVEHYNSNNNQKTDLIHVGWETNAPDHRFPPRTRDHT